MFIRFVVLASLTLGVVRSPSTTSAVDTGETCTGSLFWSGQSRQYPSLLTCDNECNAGCQSEFVTTPYGQGAVCSCVGIGWDGCCTVAIFPPSSSGIPVQVGDCGTQACPDEGTCTVFSELLGTNPIRYDSIARCE
jgi:hypothetical protein